MDRNELKAQALLEKLSYLENQNADLRVELHLALEELDAQRKKFAELAEEAASQKAAADVEETEKD